MRAAPLVGIADAPVPDNAEAFWLTAADGARLRVARFTQPGAARGAVIVSPGRAEPIEKYFEVVGELNARGFAVLVHDWRGQGLSARALPDRLMGHARGVDTFLSDFTLMLDHMGEPLPRPWISLGHSMGGALALLALARGEARVHAAVVTAPMLGIHQLRRWLPGAALGLAATVAALGLGGRYGPGAAYDPFASTFEGNPLTHDRRRFERFAAQLRACPDLAIGGVTWGWLDFALKLGAILERPRTARQVRAPLTIIGAGEDQIVTTELCRRFAQAAPRGRYLEIAGARHEILAETDAIRGRFWTAFDEAVAALEVGVTPPELS